MYQIYIISFSLVWEQLTPPMLRDAIFLNWGTVLTKPLQRLYEIIFGVYANGSTDLPYDALTAYVVGDKTVYTDRGVYECIAPSTGNLPTDTTYWVKISENYIGIRERCNYSSHKILFEYGLNRWFQCTGIYIGNNVTTTSSFVMGATGQYSSAMWNSGGASTNFMTNNYYVPSSNNYTIYVPIAVYNALASNNTDRTNIIRSFADKYTLAGIQYNVTTY